MIKVKTGQKEHRVSKNLQKYHAFPAVLLMQLYWRHWKAEEDALAFSVLASVKSGEEATAYSSVSFSLLLGRICFVSKRTCESLAQN